MHDLLVAPGAITTLVLNRPAKRNAITLAMWEALPELLGRLGANPDLRVLVVRGAGTEAFASGADISEFERVRTDVETSRRYSRIVERADRALAAFPRPTIAMVHGFCVGGGVQLALACDLRFAARDARLGITAARLGIVYGLSSTRRLAAVVGPSHARDLLFSGRLATAVEAARMGLVNRVCDTAGLEGETYAYAEGLAAQAPLTQRGAKRMLLHLEGERRMGEAELAEMIEAAYTSDDYREGVRAFLQKRRPRFCGR